MVWPTKNIGELCEILDSKRKPITKKDRVEGPYPYYGATGVLDYVEGYLFDEDLVLIGEDGAKWGAGDNSAFSISGKTWVNNHAHVLKPSRDILLDAWLIYFLNAQDLSAFISGMTVPKLNQGRLREIPVPIPPLLEQKRIVAILDQAFADIDKARALTEQNLKNARELFESYLQQVFSQCGEGWKKTTLGEATGGVFTGPFGSLLHKSDYIENGIPLVNPAHINATGINADYRKTVSGDTAEKLSSYRMRAGDIVIARRGEMGRCALINDDEDGFLCGTGSFFMKSSDRVVGSYLVSYLRSDFCRTRLEQIAGGAVMPNLSNSDLSNFSLYLPSVGKQKEIAKLVDEISSQLETVVEIYDRKIKALDELKKSLLQKAFSGELTRDSEEVAA